MYVSHRDRHTYIYIYMHIAWVQGITFFLATIISLKSLQGLEPIIPIRMQCPGKHDTLSTICTY